MNRDEVLERSRKEMKDEGMVAAENTWRKIGYFAFMIVHLFLISFNWYIKEGQTVIALNALFFVFPTFETYGKYRFTKNRWYLVTSIMSGIASLTSLLLYIAISHGR